MSDHYESHGDWEATNKLRFVERNKKRVLQQEFVKVVKMRAGCLSKPKEYKRYEWREVAYLSPTEEEARARWGAFI
jgi:hypothetical protein